MVWYQVRVFFFNLSRSMNEDLTKCSWLMQDPCSLSTFEPWMVIYVASWWFQIRLFLRWWSTLTFVSLGPVWLTHGSVHGPWIDFKSILEEYPVPDPPPNTQVAGKSHLPLEQLHVLRAPSGSSRHFSETSRGPQFDFPISNPWTSLS